MIDLRDRRAAASSATPGDTFFTGKQLGLALLLASIFFFGCQSNPKTAAPNIQSPLAPLPSRATLSPSPGDQAAADLAEAALVGKRTQMEESLNRVSLTQPSWVPLGRDLIHSTLDDPEARREASQHLLDEGTDDPLLEKRLRREIQEDQIKQANKHIFDHRHKMFARTFNAISEPLGNSVLTGMTVAPYKVAMSALQWAVAMLETDPLTIQERKALALRKQFLVGHPRHECRIGRTDRSGNSQLSNRCPWQRRTHGAPGLRPLSPRPARALLAVEPPAPLALVGPEAHELWPQIAAPAPASAPAPPVP